MTARSTFPCLLALVALAAVPACFSVPAAARDQIVLAATRMSMDQAVKMAEKKFKARVVRAESQADGSKTVYVLRLLNDSGRVWTIRVDAATGTVI